MKKLLLMISLAMLSAFSFKAQGQVKYQGEVNVAYAIGISNAYSNRFNIETVHGVRINPYLFVGGGLGFHLNARPKGGALLPAFASVRGYLFDRKISPYLNIDLGVTNFADFIVGDSGLFADGLYFSPEIGAAFKIIKAMAINIGLGYQMQYVDIDSYYGFYSEDVLALKVRFTF